MRSLYISVKSISRVEITEHRVYKSSTLAGAAKPPSKVILSVCTPASMTGSTYKLSLFHTLKITCHSQSFPFYLWSFVGWICVCGLLLCVCVWISNAFNSVLREPGLCFNQVSKGTKV